MVQELEICSTLIREVAVLCAFDLILVGPFYLSIPIIVFIGLLVLFIKREV